MQKRRLEMKTKIMFSAMAVIATAMQGFAELSVGTTPSAIPIDTAPEPGVMLFIAILFIFKFIRK